MTDLNTPESKKTPPATAVWYFVAATFAFISPTIWFRDADGPWVTIVSMTVGAVLFAAGIVVLSREIKQQREARAGENPPS